MAKTATADTATTRATRTKAAKVVKADVSDESGKGNKVPNLRWIMDHVEKTIIVPVEIDVTRFLKSKGAPEAIADTTDTTDIEAMEPGEGTETGEEPAQEKIILVWQLPDIPKVYGIATDAVKLSRAYPHWVPDLAYDVATAAACHVAPDPGGLSPGLFYAGICETNNDLWAYLMEEMKRVFPQLKN